MPNVATGRLDSGCCHEAPRSFRVISGCGRGGVSLLPQVRGLILGSVAYRALTRELALQELLGLNLATNVVRKLLWGTLCCGRIRNAEAQLHNPTLQMMQAFTTALLILTSPISPGVPIPP